MINITMHDDQELSLIVMNDEYFYNERGDRQYILALVAEEFIHTDEQLAVLIEDLDGEEE
tara:strand:- start:422 stop:601 length:180 start_codon:yes stop_codon:yes gene_type:complete